MFAQNSLQSRNNEAKNIKTDIWNVRSYQIIKFIRMQTVLQFKTDKGVTLFEPFICTSLYT